MCACVRVLECPCGVLMCQLCWFLTANPNNSEVMNELLDPSVFKNAVARWILKFKEKHRIPRCHSRH